MKKQLVLVTGLSGAGKSSVMVAFESLGYECIDNYPVELLEQFRDYLLNSIQYHYVALAIPIENAMKALRIFSNNEMIEVKLLFLESSLETLVSRYQFTRRVHPAILEQRVNTLDEAIKEELLLAQTIKPFATQVIDSSHLDVKTLSNRVKSSFGKDEMKDSMGITILSFGYRYGLPKDADFVFDVRSLPNPFYIDDLKHLTGLDAAVYDYVLAKEKTKKYLDHLKTFLDYVVEQVRDSGKGHLAIAIGCTGGQHRSVSIARNLTDFLQDDYHTYCVHRDVNKV